MPDFGEGRAARVAVHEDASTSSRRAGKMRFRSRRRRLQNHGNYIISLKQFGKWLAAQVEAEGIDIFRVLPARSADRWRTGRRRAHRRSRHRQARRAEANFEPGVDIRAKVTIFADGVRGNLTKELMQRLQLGIRPRAGAVCARHQGAVGCAARIGSSRHRDPHAGLSAAARGVRRRLHLRDARRTASRSASSSGSTTRIRCSIRTWRSSASSSIRSSAACSTGGQMVRYGAKALPEGGWNTIPQLSTSTARSSSATPADS